jgi:hypothetical protein
MDITVKKITQGNDFLKHFLKNKNHIMVTFVNKHYINLGLNWFQSMVRCKAEHDSLVVCHDKEAYNFFQQEKINSVLFDQELFFNTELANKLNKTITLKHICMKIFFGIYMHDCYKVTPIVLDADVVCLKHPLMYIAKFSQNMDTCLYAQKTYKDIVRNIKDYTGYGGFPVYYSEVFLNKLLDYGLNRTIVSLDDPLTCHGIHDVLDIMNIQYKDLNQLIFTDSDLWEIEKLKEKLSMLAYTVHYRCSTCNIDSLSQDKQILQIKLKEESMKQNNHWFI